MSTCNGPSNWNTPRCRYLTALYSLDPNRNAQAVELLSSVFVEEMIHLALAANLLNAVGGRPRIDTPQMLASYPRPVPHADPTMELSLLPFGKAALEMFLGDSNNRRTQVTRGRATTTRRSVSSTTPSRADCAGSAPNSARRTSSSAIPRGR
ncbi:ferritin-like domain-containing protein [Yinghuangia aomiensis]